MASTSPNNRRADHRAPRPRMDPLVLLFMAGQLLWAVALFLTIAFLFLIA